MNLFRLSPKQVGRSSSVVRARSLYRQRVRNDYNNANRSLPSQGDVRSLQMRIGYIAYGFSLSFSGSRHHDAEPGRLSLIEDS